MTGIDFDVDSTGDFSDAVAEITLLNLEREPGAVPELLPSQNTELDVSVNGCGSPVDALLSVYPDPRWWLAVRAGRRGEAQRLALRRGGDPQTRTIPPGMVKGIAAVAIPGAIDEISAFVSRGSKRIPLPTKREIVAGEPGTFTLIQVKVTKQALGHLLLRSILGQTIHFEFQAPWVHPRGFLSCFVSLPALVEGQATFMTSIGASGLAISSTTSATARGPEVGVTKLQLRGGSLQASASSPPPIRSQVIPTWTCQGHVHAPSRLRPDCHSNVVIEEAQGKEWRQVLIFILGAIGAAGFVGFFDGLRRLLVPW